MFCCIFCPFRQCYSFQDLGLGYIEVDFDFDEIRINPDGSLVSLNANTTGHCAIYDVETKSRMFQFKAPNQARPRAFTDDFRFLLYEDLDGNGLTIVRLFGSEEEIHLNADGYQTEISATALDIKSCSIALFRRIHDIQHLQLVKNGTGILKLYKNSKQNEWDLQ